jgi:hypothetical protein
MIPYDFYMKCFEFEQKNDELMRILILLLFKFGIYKEYANIK